MFTEVDEKFAKGTWYRIATLEWNVKLQDPSVPSFLNFSLEEEYFGGEKPQYKFCSVVLHLFLFSDPQHSHLHNGHIHPPSELGRGSFEMTHEGISTGRNALLVPMPRLLH